MSMQSRRNALVVVAEVSLLSFMLMQTCHADLIVYATDTIEPEEMAFDSSGNLYVGHSENVSGLSIYRIGPGGGAAQAYGGGAFADPDGLDVDADGNVWVASGKWSNTLEGEVMKISADGQVSVVGNNYLRNPTSLEIDRIGRFGSAGSLLVAQQNSGIGGAEILSVEPTGSYTSLFSTTDYWTVRSLCFDSASNLWFTEGSQLYKWANGVPAPEAIIVTGLTGNFTGVNYDSVTDTLVASMSDERRVVRIALNGTLQQELATDIDPRTIAFDAAGNIYVSDAVADVVWVVPEPSAMALLIVGITFTAMFVWYRRRA